MSKVTKVTSIYYVEDSNESNYATGLYVRLEDGRVLRHLSTDYITPFDQLKEDSEVAKTIKAMYE